jgi:uncharacterized membrane protein YhaH (DUF805 family)
MERNWMNLLFSFDGRISRSGYWWGSGAIVAGIFATLMICIALIFTFDALSLKPVGTTLALILYIAMIIGCIWAGYALAVKRLHDQGMSGWWLLLQFLPYLGPLALFIILGFLPGTEGPNEFGVSPNGNVMMNGRWSASASH